MHRRLLRRRAGVLLANAARGGPRIRQAFRQPTSGAPARGLHLPGLHSALHRCDAARLYRRPARRGRAATAGCRLDSRPRSRSESARVAEGRVSAAYGPSDARGRCGHLSVRGQRWRRLGDAEVPRGSHRGCRRRARDRRWRPVERQAAAELCGRAAAAPPRHRALNGREVVRRAARPGGGARGLRAGRRVVGAAGHHCPGREGGL
mmetsp:Transcript_14557/g.47446  ORF Transcript_14557/g.47446 Transcript_14557/m.47446 type:complete len:206 (+) Transcript_14557:175-792(+)